MTEGLENCPILAAGYQEDQLEKIMQRVAERAVFNTLRDLGLHAGDDMGAVFEVRRDFQFLREWRQTCESVRSRGTFYILTLILAALSALLVMGAKSFFH